MLKLLFDCYCQNFHLCRHNQPHSTTKLLNFTTKQTISPLLLFHVNGASERKVIPETEKASGYSNSMVQSKVKVHKINVPGA